jgi:RNA polymerase sigma-70 factor, ECF subfamily
MHAAVPTAGRSLGATLSSAFSPLAQRPASGMRSEPASDETLLERSIAGQSGAFEQLVRRHHDDLLRFLIRLTGNRVVAEDAFQETFLQVHVSATTFDPTRRFKPWLFTIAANKARDAMRRNARRRALDLDAPMPGQRGGSSGGGNDSGGARTFVDLLSINMPSPSSQLDEREQSRMVQQAIDGLPWALREILLLAYFQRLSYNQIAEMLEIPLGTVKSRLHSAVAAFAKKWEASSTGETNGSGGGKAGAE